MRARVSFFRAVGALVRQLETFCHLDKVQNVLSQESGQEDENNGGKNRNLKKWHTSVR